MKRIFIWLTENKTPRQTVLKNTVWLFTGQVGSRLLRAVIVIYAARVLGAAHWGAFSYALGIVTFLTVFSDIGINALITKEASRDPSLKDRYLGTAFFVKLCLLAALALLTLILFPRVSTIAEATRIMPILIFVFAFDTLRDLGSALARALERMQIEAMSALFTNLVIAVAGVALLWMHRTSYALALGYALGSGLGFVALAYGLRGYVRVFIRHIDLRLVGRILKTAWPFGLMGMLGAIMLNTDIIMLGSLRTPAEVGYYSSAQKLIQLLYVLPTFFASSIFPLMSRLVHDNEPRARRLLERTVRASIAAALPITLLGIAAGPFIIRTFFGAAYAPATHSFQILMVSILFTYPSILIGNAIFAYDRQKEFVTFVIVAALGNVFWNAVLIPRFGIEGAAMGTVLTQLMTDTWMWRRMHTINGFRFWSRRGL